MDNLINREAALAAVADAIADGRNVYRALAEVPVVNAIKSIPAADVVDGETYRELLKAARKMHCWIFLNTADELEAYDECGLTDEMNALLGYGGQFTAKMDGGVNDGV